MGSENEPPIHPPGNLDEEGGGEVYMKDGFQPARAAFSGKLPLTPDL
jgi:hypothetical protein